MARCPSLRRRGCLPQKLGPSRVSDATALNVNQRRSALGNLFDCQCTPPHAPLQSGDCESQALSHKKSVKASSLDQNPTVAGEDEVIAKLKRGTVLMDAALSQSTGLKERERKLVTYWTLATHALRNVDTFPLLCLNGKMGTGKSQTEKIIAKFAYRSHPFGLRGRTQAVIRDELAACYEGTAIVEEADYAWKDGEAVFERLLSDRYQRASAEAGLKQKCGENWESVTKEYFGATVLHRRIPFNDAALDGRSVTVRFRADHSRKYTEYSDDDPLIVEGSELLSELVLKPPTVEQPPRVAARIFNTYKLLLSVAKLCGDEGFPELIRSRLLLETAELKEAQSAEPDGLVLRAILDQVSVSGGYGNIKISILGESIFRNHRVSFQPRQVAGMARQLGFNTKNSHGVTVVAPTPATLLAACEECGYEDDEAIAELRQQVLGPADG